jgi:hypothetical protein
MAAADLSQEALIVLKLLGEKAMDGYTILSKSGLSRVDLSAALKELKANSMIDASGDLGEDRIGEAYLWVLPSAKRYADYVAS